MTGERSASRRPLARIPVSTYRVQFHRGFTFAQARAIAPYLQQLGVTELYASPYFRPRPGSTHGYDVCEYGRLNPDLGAEDYPGFCDALAAAGLGQLLDIVPNHMAADPRYNPWWRDVLRRGARSEHAATFDIDWTAGGGKLLVPILGDEYEAVLTRGELRLVLENERVWVAYFDHRLPVANDRVTARPSDVERFNGRPGDRASHDALDRLLDSLPFRLTHWSKAATALNYRRFFDIATLAGVRMERDAVFAASHTLLLQLISEGRVSGVRVDHPDGMADPAAYFEQLDGAVRSALERAGRAAASGSTVYIAVEKILTGSEALRPDWAVDGTTGYNFLNELNGLFVDSRGEDALRRLLQDVTGERWPIDDLLRRCKREILETLLGSELTDLDRRLGQLVDAGPGHPPNRREALIELIACFPVYRTYIGRNGPMGDDRMVIDQAVSTARRQNPALTEWIDRIRDLLLRETRDDDTPHHLAFVTRFQQLTGPVQAKGLEDTLFYRYPLLLSLNEVGGDPSVFGRSVDAFHDAAKRRRQNWPHELLATTTHDTKRAEDARARINVLSELPGLWSDATRSWFELNRRCRTMVGDTVAPSPVHEYLFYQSLAGAWPAESAPERLPHEASRELRDRMVQFMTKAARESKQRTSWIKPDPGYEQALTDFVDGTLRGPHAAAFLASFLPIQRRIAYIGMINALAQVVLKIAAPGVPDFYQGTELWDLSLVDPDNRRPVDFSHRQRLLTELEPVLTHLASPPAERGPQAREAINQAWTELLSHWPDGRVKLLVTTRGLRVRRRRPSVFLEGAHRPLKAAGPNATNVVAFARTDPSTEETIIAVVPRLAAQLVADNPRPPLGTDTWGSTRVILTGATATEYENLLTGEMLQPVLERGVLHLAAADLFRVCPVALLRSGHRSAPL